MAETSTPAMHTMSYGRGFRIYVGVMLFLITLLLAILVIGLAYGASKVSSLQTQVNDFSKRTDSIDQGLQQLNSNLQNTNSSVPPGYTAQ